MIRRYFPDLAARRPLYLTDLALASLAVAVYRQGVKPCYIPPEQQHRNRPTPGPARPPAARIQTKHLGPDPWRRMVIAVGVEWEVAAFDHYNTRTGMNMKPLLYANKLYR